MRPEIHLSIPVLHVDTFLLVADKPTGLLSVPAGGPGRDDCLAARIQAAGYRVGLALLLGLMLFATWNDLQQLRVFKILGGVLS